MTQLALGQVAIEFGATTLLKDVTFTVAAGEKWGIVGRNGTGKTSLIRLITGQNQPSRGQVSRTPGLRITLLDQHRGFGDAETVWEAVANAYGDLYKLEKSLHAQAEAMAHTHDDAALEKYGRDLERFEREGGYEMDARVDAVIDGLGFDSKAARTRQLANLSGGERGRVGLARQLVAPADVMILDEPTNHLDLDTTRWLEGYLRQTDRTVLLISHDRAFLEAVVDHVLHLEGGTAFAYTGDYESFVRQRNERRLTQQRQFDKQQDKIAAETDYIARNLAGQNTRQAKGRRKRLERMPRLSSPIGESGVMSLRLEAKERGGDMVLVAEKLAVAVEGRVLLEDFDVRLPRGETVGLVGPNGAGKSTLLKTLMGERGPASGIGRLGPGTRPAYYRQDLSQVPLDKPLYDIISDLKPQWERRFVQGHLGRFGFSGDEVMRTASTLSGGERARVALAMLMLSGANLLILDEPTNHLDVESIEVLEDALEEYDGTVILVSHDRALLRASATTVWALDDQEIEVFDGSFPEWEEREDERRAQRAQKHADHEARRRAKEREKKAEAEKKSAEDAARARAAAGKPAKGANNRSAAVADRSAARDDRRQARELERRAREAEQRVQELETRVAALTTALDDPTMYDSVEGAAKAAELGRELDAAQRGLESAMTEWASATEALEALA